VHQCSCGFDFRVLAAEVANDDLVAINAAIYRASGFPLGDAAEESNRYHFPPEMARLGLGSLLMLVQFVGCAGGDRMARWKQRRLPSTDLATVTDIGRIAAEVLRDWPRQLREALRRMLPAQRERAADVSFRDVFGNFYRHLLRVLPRADFGFLQEAFEEFVVEDWNGVLRRNSRCISFAIHRSTPWIPTDEAERLTHTVKGTIWGLVHTGELEGFFVELGQRRECWIRRESLNQWIATRDLELARYMSRAETKRTLGLTHITILRVAQADLIRHVNGSEHYFPAGVHFLREDVMQIKHAFQEHGVPAKAYSKPGQLIALRHAMKNYLGRDAGLAGVIRAVVDGHLVPVGYTKRFRGITGYLFSSDELRKYRPVSDVQIFGERYVAISVLANRFRLPTISFAGYLRESDTPLLTIPIVDAGRGQAVFLRRDVAAQMQLPSRKMLREQALRRIEGRPKAAVGRVQAIQGDRPGQINATSASETSLTSDWGAFAGKLRWGCLPGEDVDAEESLCLQ
jgi:hypothetical protein